MSIKLTKVHFGKNPRFVVTPNWISNGDWAVKRSRVTNSAIFDSEASIRAVFSPNPGQLIRIGDSDNMIDRLQASTADLRAFAVTNWTYDDRLNLRYALATCDAMHTYLNRAYLAMLESPVQVYAVNGESVVSDGIDLADRTFYLMPACIAKDGSHLAPLVSLVHLLDLKADQPAEGVA